MAPKSFVIEPEFNDLPSGLDDNSSVRGACSVKQVNHRLYPTYRISVKDNSLCGVSPSSSSSTSLNDNAARNNHVHLQGLSGEQTDGPQHSGLDELDKLDDTIYASKASLLVLHIRFPVVKSLRTDEDIYVSLVCAPEIEAVVSRRFAASSTPNKPPVNPRQDRQRHEQTMPSRQALGNGLRAAGDLVEPSMEESQVVSLVGLESTKAGSTDVVWPSGVLANSIRRVGELAVDVAAPASSAQPIGLIATTDRPRGTTRQPATPDSGRPPPVLATQLVRGSAVKVTGSTSSLLATKAELTTSAAASVRTLALPISTTTTTTTSKPANVSDLNLSAFTTGRLGGRSRDYNVAPVMEDLGYSATLGATRPGAYSEARGSGRRHVTNCTLDKHERPRMIGSDESELNVFLLVLFLALLIIIFIFVIVLDNLSNS